MAAFAVVAAGASARTTVNARPATIPAVRIWRGSYGFFRLSARPRIVVPGGFCRSLGPTARLFAADLRALTKRQARLACGRAGRADLLLKLGARNRRLGAEGYQLTIGRAVTIAARTPTGVFYGTRTLLQLLHERPRALPKGTARDWPRYPERGLMIDLGRRVYTMRWIEAEIKELAYLKMNILHLHLTDDQRWGIESDLHRAIVSPRALTKREVRQILAVAARYHVTVVPEIDMPAHLGALLAKHPGLELKAAATVSPPPTGRLDISNPAALQMVRQLLDEYLPLFPGPFWDVGGDEYMRPADEHLYPQLQLYARQRYGQNATIKDAILGFFNWVNGIVRAHHKTLWAWHDELGGGTAVFADRDIQASWWIGFSPLSEPMPPTPQQLLDAGHELVNDGWFPTYYTEDLGPVQGKPSMQKAYTSWEVNQFCSPTHNDQFFEPCFGISASEPGNLGSTINAWDDHELSDAQLARGLTPRLMVLAQKTWNSPELTHSYGQFERIMARIRRR